MIFTPDKGGVVLVFIFIILTNDAFSKAFLFTCSKELKAISPHACRKSALAQTKKRLHQRLDSNYSIRVDLFIIFCGRLVDVKYCCQLWRLMEILRFIEDAFAWTFV